MRKERLERALDVFAKEREKKVGESLLFSDVVGISEIPLSKIDLKDTQFKFRFDMGEREIEELAKSIKEGMLINPIVVRRKNGMYQILSGFRRFEAVKRIGMKKIKAILVDVSDDEAYRINFDENLKRKNLSHLEIALTIDKLRRVLKKKDDEITKLLGIKYRTMMRYLKLLTLSDDIKKALHRGELNFTHAQLLSKLKDERIQNILFEKVLREKLTKRQLEKEVERLKSKELFRYEMPERFSKKVKFYKRENVFHIKLKSEDRDELREILKLILEMVD
ncbi:MAG: ParB/RepB/Spo0J family partition protein [Candidatus Methanofastidiosia archaeon]